MLRRLLAMGLAGGILAVPATAGRHAAPFAVPGDLRVVAYYPAHDGWTYMWRRWKPDQIDRDFALIAGLHANTVRVFLQPPAFGYPRPRADALAKLDTLFTLAQRHGLSLELTLFDWWWSYADVQGSQTWAKAVLSRYAGDPRLACVELRNELDPYDPKAVAWARQLLPYVRSIAGGTPVTLSVSGNDPLGRLKALSAELAPVAPDFWSFHYYDKAEYAYWTLASARAAVAPVPLVLAETGYQSGASVPQPRTREERDEEQVRYLRTIMNATALLGMPPAGVWVLLDFTRGASPLRMPADEYSFGLFRADGTPKPAAEAARAAFAAPGVVDRDFDGGFEDPGLSTWRAHGAGAFARDGTTAHGGSASAAVGGTGKGIASLTTIPTDPWVVPGQTVTLSAWARGVAATGRTVVQLQWLAGDRTRLGSADSEPLPDGTTGWTQLQVTASAPAGVAFVRIALVTSGDSGSVRFDDVALDGAGQPRA
ncbi:MAG TPA: carbohydrate binding domain-containing protein [Gaiellaceae bacterium]|nr:carbohydrate binding domain-containing protein [Gaiellaceae bacterium]